ncbi:MAG: photosystem biosis protein BtpA, partial [Cyanobacteriota bacterium]
TTAVTDTIERGLADGIILSGWATGSPPSQEDLELARNAAKDTPIFIGSGANEDNIGHLIQAADGVIVASSLKRHGKITETIDPIRVAAFIEAMQEGLAAQKPLVEMTPPLKSAVV